MDREELAKKALEHHKSALAQASRNEYEVLKGGLRSFVEAKIKGRCDPLTFAEMPIIASVNMLKRVIGQEASIYRNTPNRSLAGTDAEIELFNKAYKDIDVDRKLNRANRVFKNSKQSFLYIVAKDGKLKGKVFCKHHVFVEHEDGDAKTYVIIGGDTSKPETARLTVWSKENNYIMDGAGKMISEDDRTAFPGILPFIDISDEDEKDFAFYVESDPSLFEFTVELNAALSDLIYIMRQQGFAIGVISAPKAAMDIIKKEKITVGPSKWLVLPSDVPAGTGDDAKPAPVTAQFINPSPDLQGSIEVISSLLSAFLTSRGVDPKTISFGGDSKSFASGWERLLALIEKFEATKDDFEVFYRVEYQLFDLVRKMLDSVSGGKGYSYTGKISDAATFEVEFAEPAMIETGKEKDERLAFREDRQWITKSQAMAEALGISEEDAEARLKDREPKKEEVKPKTEESNEQGTDNEDAAAR